MKLTPVCYNTDMHMGYGYSVLFKVIGNVFGEMCLSVLFSFDL